MCIICDLFIILSLIPANDRFPINLLKEEDIDEIVIEIIKIKIEKDRENKFIIRTSKL